MILCDFPDPNPTWAESYVDFRHIAVIVDCITTQIYGSSPQSKVTNKWLIYNIYDNEVNQRHSKYTLSVYNVRERIITECMKPARLIPPNFIS